VDQNIEAAQRPEYLQGNWVDLLFLGHIASNAMDARISARNVLHTFTPAGDESNLRPAAEQFADERQAQAGSASGKGYSQASQWIMRRFIFDAKLFGGKK
jgi:hypothetical protein